MKNSPASHHPNWIMPIIVLAQFAGTSLWFAGNAILPFIQTELSLNQEIVGHITSAVQLGFIMGTLIFALLNFSDRMKPGKLFFICSCLGAAANLAILVFPLQVPVLLLFRFLTGIFLAGIYPVGMKIAADWRQKGLGKALGYLVGALVLGTAFPYLLIAFGPAIPWFYILIGTSGLAVMGGLLLWLLVPDGPYRKENPQEDFRIAFKIFKNKTFRQTAIGYFGHMWELYTFWAFVPVMLVTYSPVLANTTFTMAFYSFSVIAAGSFACVIGGYLSEWVGSKTIALSALALSMVCGFLSPWLFTLPLPLFIACLILWGMVVIADSPQLSALAAQSLPKEFTGTGLTILNCLGFFITVISLQVINTLRLFLPGQYLFLFLSIGPVIGLYALFKIKRYPGTT